MVQVEQARAAWLRVSRADTATEHEVAIASYNSAVAKLVDRLRCGSGTYHEKSAAMGATIDESRSLGVGIRIADIDALIPAAAVSTESVGTRHRVEGIGVPVVAWKKTAQEGRPRWEFEPPTGVPLMLTRCCAFLPAARRSGLSFIRAGQSRWRWVPGRSRLRPTGRRRRPFIGR
jgi:hypothetical protein